MSIRFRNISSRSKKRRMSRLLPAPFDSDADNQIYQRLHCITNQIIQYVIVHGHRLPHLCKRGDKQHSDPKCQSTVQQQTDHKRPRPPHREHLKQIPQYNLNQSNDRKTRKIRRFRHGRPIKFHQQKSSADQKSADEQKKEQASEKSVTFSLFFQECASSPFAGFLPVRPQAPIFTLFILAQQNLFVNKKFIIFIKI